MEIKPLAELTTPDERVLRFTPMGLGTSMIMTPEGALNHQQGTIAELDLLPQVPDTVRERFERLRLLHVYGFFQYEFFTMVEEASYFVVEVALRQRFLEAYGRRIPWRSNQGAVASVEVSNYEGVLECLKQYRSAPKVERPWQLVSLDGSGIHAEFNGSLRSLFKWARAEGLLYGQRTYIRDHALLELRNRTAHPERGKLITPVDSTFAIRDLAELINQLWGDPSGQAYPKEIQRSIHVIGRNADHTSATGLTVEQVLGLELRDCADYVFEVFRAVDFGDLMIDDLDPEFQTTEYETEMVWGPGTLEALRMALHEGQVPLHCDVVRCVDRRFIVRTFQGLPERARSVEQFLSVNSDPGPGKWHVVVADTPSLALHHCGGGIFSDRHSDQVGRCECGVICEGVFEDWEEAQAFLRS